MKKALHGPERKTFRNKYLAVLVMALSFCFGAIAQTDSTKYSKINGYGFIYKRMGTDSIQLIPLSTSPHVPYRHGAIRYNPTDSTIEYWTATQWIKAATGGAVAVDTFYAANDSTLILESGGNVFGAVVGTSRLDSLHIYTAASPDPDTLYSFKNGDSTLIGYIPKGDGGITELTGDVTAGPGDGSQVATIASNAVTDAKFRQSAGNSVVGKSSSGTGNVADIIASLAGQALQYNGTVIGWDSVDYANLKNVPPTVPGIYIAPYESFNPGFLVLATGIVRPSNSWSSGVTIDWAFLTSSSNHNYSFFDSVYGHASNSRLVVRFPNVKNVLNVTIVPDETFSGNATFIGPTVGLVDFEAAVYKTKVVGIRLRGNSTTTWTETSLSSQFNALFDLSTYNTSDGGTSFNVQGANSIYGVDYNSIGIQYIGTNGYRIKRTYSGLGAYNIRFNLLDDFGNAVSVNPTSNDEIIITNSGMATEQVSMRVFNTTNTFMGTFTNWWIIGAFEAWMVAAPISSTSIQVRYQTVYPSATDYKISRSTSLHGTYTLVHQGTEGIFTDAGLTANTIYYYKMVAVVGSDVDVTTFRTNTNF